MNKYRSKVVEIEAVQWTGDNFNQIYEWAQGMVELDQPDSPTCVSLNVKTLEGESKRYEGVEPGYWIIKGTEGEFYPVKNSVFQRKYEPVEDPANDE